MLLISPVGVISPKSAPNPIVDVSNFPPPNIKAMLSIEAVVLRFK